VGATRYDPQMRKTTRLLLSAFTIAGCVNSATPPATEAVNEKNAGVDETAIDKSVDPCDDFFAYACGGWLKTHEMPPDRSQYGRFAEIEDRNLATLHDILDDAAAKRGESFPFRDKVGAFYAACMDEAKVETASLPSLQAALATVDKVRSFDDGAKLLAKLHLEDVNALFHFESEQDFADATQMIGALDQGGLGLPDRDYYLENDEKSVALRKKYEEHVAAMLKLAGVATAEKDAETVLRVETALAKASMSRVDRRDPKKIYHRINLDGIVKTAPHFPWREYLVASGHGGVTAINVRTPEFFAALDGSWEKTPLADLKAYLRWHVVHASADALGKGFVDENFHFYGATLAGTKELEPRWKRCAHSVDHALGEALAIPYVKRTFGDEGKQATRSMVKEIEAAMGADVKTLAWMDEPTRAAATEKLAKIDNMIGFPDKWRNYDQLGVAEGQHFANVMAGREFESHRQLNKIGKPVDKSEWGMTPPTVNAYYDPSLNEMVFPAGILQPPFYGRTRAPALNYGAIGMVMGHELTHGFDDEGRKFDAVGNLRDWWTPAVDKEFETRAACVKAQFDGYEVVDGKHINGSLTLGENLADLGGIKLAHAAMKSARPESAAAPAGGYSEEQLFFLGVGQAWCTKRTPELEAVRLKVDPHSTPRFRVDGPLSNMPEFAAAFSCKPGSKMVRAADSCTVW
jgi:endothelin-converting enzyme/putative endopeptidase